MAESAGKTAVRSPAARRFQIDGVGVLASARKDETILRPKKNNMAARTNLAIEKEVSGFFGQYRLFRKCMQRKILFSPQESRVDAPIHAHIPPEFTQPVKPTAIGSVEIGG